MKDSARTLDAQCVILTAPSEGEATVPTFQTKKQMVRELP